MLKYILQTIVNPWLLSVNHIHKIIYIIFLYNVSDRPV